MLNHVMHYNYGCDPANTIRHRAKFSAREFPQPLLNSGICRRARKGQFEWDDVILAKRNNKAVVALLTSFIRPDRGKRLNFCY